MRLLIALLGLALAFGNCEAQTNAPLIINFTNSDGIYITNAEVIKILPNKLFYKTEDGGGMVKLSELPKTIQERLHFDPVLASQAEVADRLKKSETDHFYQQQ